MCQAWRWSDKLLRHESSEYFAFLVVLYYSDSVRSIVCTDVVLFGAVCFVCCCFVLCVVVASRVSCVRRGGGPISCCGTEAQSVIRSPDLPGVARDGYRVTHGVCGD